MPDMDEQAIKVLARFTEAGQWWPVGAWVYVYYEEGHQHNLISHWYLIKNVKTHDLRIKLAHEWSEIEANQKGIFRNLEVKAEK